MEPSFFKGNRRRLAEALEPNSLLVMTAFGRVQRDNTEPHPYLQEANFWYLTGINEPEWLLVLDVDSGEEWLIAPKQNSYQLAFQGEANHDAISRQSGVAEVLTKEQGKDALGKLLAKKKRAYSLVPKWGRVYGFQANAAPRKLLRQLKGIKIVDVQPILAKQRGVKQQVEIDAIQAAVDITVDGLLAVLKEMATFTTENEIDAKLHYEFRRQGATHGFEPIITSGAKP